MNLMHYCVHLMNENVINSVVNINLIIFYIKRYTNSETYTTMSQQIEDSVININKKL